MKKSILFPVFLFCFLFFYGQNNESYSKIKINISDWNQLTLLAKSGVNLENLDFNFGIRFVILSIKKQKTEKKNGKKDRFFHKKNNFSLWSANIGTLMVPLFKNICKKTIYETKKIVYLRSKTRANCSFLFW
jgi:hypothetical protein